MRNVCLVNNYNYEKYIGACLDSVVNQTSKFDAVYIVDDGSSDNSRLIIEGYCNDFQEVIPIYKKNGGQLSCFNAAVDFIGEDDLVFLLDSDDIYPKDYVEKLLEIVRLNKADMYFCDTDVFVNDNAPQTCVVGPATVFVIPASSLLTQVTQRWVGMPTSSMVVSGQLFTTIFPYPHESDWRTRADDILVYGSSLAGFSKVFTPSLHIGYRSHGENEFLGKKFDKSYLKKRKYALRTLFLWCYDKFSLPRIPSLILLFDEYKKSKHYFQSVLRVNICELYAKYAIYLLKELFESLRSRSARDKRRLDHV